LLYSYIGNVLITIAGICSGDNNLDQFINIGGLCSVGRFCTIGVFSCNNGRGG
jgi:hypothetical protein